MFPFIVTVLAESSDIVGSVTDGINGVINIIKGIANPLGMLAVVIMGIYMIFASDPQNIKKVKSWFIAVAMGLIMINLAQPIINGIQAIGK